MQATVTQIVSTPVAIASDMLAYTNNAAECDMLFIYSWLHACLDHCSGQQAFVNLKSTVVQKAWLEDLTRQS